MRMRKYITSAVVFVCIAFLSVVVWGNDQWLQGRQVLAQTAPVWVLIIVTAYYAWNSLQQAEASRRMVEKMEQQRLDAVQPEVVLCHTTSSARNATIDFKQVSPVNTIQLMGPVEVHNFGVGLARDIVSTIVVNGHASPDVALPPLAPEFWTLTDLSPHWAWLEANRLQEQGSIPASVHLQLRYRDTFGESHMTTLHLKHNDNKGDYSYSVERVDYSHRPSGGIKPPAKPSSDGSGRVTPPASIGL
ncbi:MAG: hypothetical protein HYU86_05030 [Chloroflexi bacterium]|nr:hypothetical protein [Chloroflexota bacterium]